MSEARQTDLQEHAMTEWRRIVIERDWDAFGHLAAESVIYHSPVSLEPIRGRDALIGTLRVVFSVMEDFQYVRDFARADGVALEFTAAVGSEVLTGVDLIRFDEAGKLSELIVAMRPAGTVLTLVAEASKALPE